MTPIARAVSQGLRHSQASDAYKLRILATLFQDVDNSINERARLEALVDLCTEDGQVLVIRDSRDCDGTQGRYKVLLPADWRKVRDYMDRELAKAEGPQSFMIRCPSRYEVY
jgi:hypothetical protein